MADAFDKAAEKQSDEVAKNHFKNYFAREVALTEEQQQILKTIAHNFTGAFQLASYKEKLTLALSYRNELKKLFGDDEIKRFDEFVNSRITPNVKIVNLKAASF